MADTYGIANFSIGGRNYTTTGTFEAAPKYFLSEPIVGIEGNLAFSEKAVPASITGTVLKPKDVNLKDILTYQGTITLKNGQTGKTFTLSSARQTGDGKYNPYSGEVAVAFTGEQLDEA